MPTPAFPRDPDAHLLKAVQRNDLRAAQEALARGANVHLRYNASVTDGHDRSLLIAAVQCGNDAMVGFLLDQGLDPNANAQEGETATSEAWSHKRTRFALLQRRGGDLGLAYRNGQRGVLLQTLELLENDLQYNLERAQGHDGWLTTGGDLPALIRMGLDWHRPDATGLTPHRALFDWFPAAFADRVMGWRAEQEQTVLRASLDDPLAIGSRPRARL